MRSIFIAGGLLAGLALGATAQAAEQAQVQIRVAERALIVDGTPRADVIALRVSPANPTQVVVDVDEDGVADLRVRRDRFDRIVVLAGGGDDTVDVVDGPALTEPITLEGGAGADALTGGRGTETFVGGSGDDVVDGNGGADVAFLGTGADRFSWHPGDGSDVVEGQGDRDELTFTGSNVAEQLDVSASGRRVSLRRDAGAVTMDLVGIERIATSALGGTDTFTATDLGQTDVEELDTDLAGEPGGATADGKDDRVVLDGSGGEDQIEIAGTARATTVAGLATSVRLRNADPDDALTVRAQDGDDSVDARTLRVGAPRLTIDGGDDDDNLVGGPGDDVVLGGAGEDDVDAGRGDDVVLLGENADTFRWDPAEGSDTVEGQEGRDALIFTGAAANERIAASPNGQRVRVTRNIGAVELDLADIEELMVDPLGGEDTFRIEDLSGTSVRTVVADLAREPGGTTGDRQIDALVVKGTTDPDNLAVSGANGTVNVTGLPVAIQIINAEARRDKVSVDGRRGVDTFDPTGLAPDTIAVTFVQ